MKKNYIAPEISMVVVANEDVMTTSAIQTPWMNFGSAFSIDDVDGYAD